MRSVKIICCLKQCSTRNQTPKRHCNPAKLQLFSFPTEKFQLHYWYIGASCSSKYTDFVRVLFPYFLFYITFKFAQVKIVEYVLKLIFTHLVTHFGTRFMPPALNTYGPPLTHEWFLFNSFSLV